MMQHSVQVKEGSAMRAIIAVLWVALCPAVAVKVAHADPVPGSGNR